MKRIKIIAVFIGVLFLALILRLAYIQIIGHDELAAATRAQSLISLEGSNTRGIIYDRNGIPLVADKMQYIFIIKEDRMDGGARKLLEDIDAQEVTSDNIGYYVASSEEYDKAKGRKLINSYGAYIIRASARYSDEQIAAHLIGYVNKDDSTGAAGIELMYDERLSGLKRSVYAVADVEGNILPGRGLLIATEGSNDSYIAEGIRTTIDKDLQTEVEKIIEEVKNDCAVVVLEAKSGGLAAMASTPGFDPDNVAEYLEEGSDELINKAAQGEYPPGSVFKIVTAAAALEEGIDEDVKYTCSGHVELSEISIGCDTGGQSGHGEIGFHEAFASSCNCFFVELAKDTGASKIVETAEKMGLGARILQGFPQEASGHLMTASQRAGDAVGNLAIGQGETLVTPLQVAAVTNIIANRGIDKGIKLLMDEEEKEEQVISAKTAETIGKMMELAAEEGTAVQLELTDEGGKAEAAVKTGTAEYGQNNEGAHAWITGYAPCDEPEYVVTVLVDGGGSGSAAAGPIFEKIIEYLKDSGSFSMPVFA